MGGGIAEPPRRVAGGGEDAPVADDCGADRDLTGRAGGAGLGEGRGHRAGAGGVVAIHDASSPALCYQAGMTDSNDDDRGRKGGRKGPRRPDDRGGDRPFRKPAGDKKPFRSREGDERPYRKPAGAKPFRSRDGDERPARSREDGERPYRKPAGAKPFRSRGGDERPARSREEGVRPYRKPAGAKPYRSRDGEERPHRPREEGERPYRKPVGAKPYRPREDGGRPFRRDDERPRRSSEDERPFRPRREIAPPREPRVEAEPAPPPEPAEERIAKVIARAGIASRRDAEAMIAEGRVTLNGEVLASPAVNVGPGDRITVDGEPLPAKERTRLWLFHKPRGTVTTARDPEGRPTVFEQLPEEMPRAVAIGRLDINTEGLLLLTNDGGLAKVIAHPDTGWLRRYRVRAHGDVEQAELDKLADGVTVDGMEYGPVEARLDRAQGDNVWITLGLREGKNREVKRILEQLGLQVNRLIRLSFGPFQLGDLEVGLVEEVRTKVLKEQLGAALAAEAGVDFESPVREPIAPFGAPAASPHEHRGERRYEPRERRPFRDERERHAPEREERPKPDRFAPKRSVWRAGEENEPPPRRGPKREDPHRARAEGAGRPRERVGTIASEGRKVRVERLVSAPAADDRPRRRGPPPNAEERAREGRPPRAGGERPSRARGDDDRRGPPRGGFDAKPRSGPKGPPRAGAGGPRGAKRPPGPKGPPRGRR